MLHTQKNSLMAEHFEPVIFEENPFFFEMGLREAQSWGLSGMCPAGYVRKVREAEIHRAHPILFQLEEMADRIYDMDSLGLCQALLRIAERFGEEARKRLPDASTGKARKYLQMMADITGRIPAQPPETFAEGLCMLLFTREAIATLEGIGVSQLGHVDRLLGPLYEKDIAEGRLTRDEAAVMKPATPYTTTSHGCSLRSTISWAW